MLNWIRLGCVGFVLILGFNALLALRDSEGLKRLEQRNQNLENLISNTQ
tara:strand:+ start:475 stop:621 length:147 start_codon:yes stop_codon:yes gene_type:complete